MSNFNRSHNNSSNNNNNNNNSYPPNHQRHYNSRDGSRGDVAGGAGRGGWNPRPNAPPPHAAAAAAAARGPRHNSHHSDSDAPRRNLLQDNAPTNHHHNQRGGPGPGARQMAHIHLHDRDRNRQLQQQIAQRQKEKTQNYQQQQRQQQQQQQQIHPQQPQQHSQNYIDDPYHQPTQHTTALQEARDRARKKAGVAASSSSLNRSPQRPIQQQQQQQQYNSPQRNPQQSNYGQQHQQQQQHQQHNSPTRSEGGSSSYSSIGGPPPDSAAANRGTMGRAAGVNNRTMSSWRTTTTTTSGGSTSNNHDHHRRDHSNPPMDRAEAHRRGSEQQQQQQQQQQHYSQQQQQQLSGSRGQGPPHEGPPRGQYSASWDRNSRKNHSSSVSRPSAPAPPPPPAAAAAAVQRPPVVEQPRQQQQATKKPAAADVVDLLDDSSSDEDGPVNPMTRKKQAFVPASSSAAAIPSANANVASTTSAAIPSANSAGTSSSAVRRPSGSSLPQQHQQRPTINTGNHLSARRLSLNNATATINTGSGPSASRLSLNNAVRNNNNNNNKPMHAASVASSNSGFTASRLKLVLKRKEDSSSQSHPPPQQQQQQQPTTSAQSSSTRPSTLAAAPAAAPAVARPPHSGAASSHSSSEAPRVRKKRAPPRDDSRASASSSTSEKAKQLKTAYKQARRENRVVEIYSSDDSDSSGNNDDEIKIVQPPQKPAPVATKDEPNVDDSENAVVASSIQEPASKEQPAASKAAPEENDNNDDDTRGGVVAVEQKTAAASFVHSSITEGSDDSSSDEDNKDRAPVQPRKKQVIAQKTPGLRSPTTKVATQASSYSGKEEDVAEFDGSSIESESESSDSETSTSSSSVSLIYAPHQEEILRRMSGKVAASSGPPPQQQRKQLPKKSVPSGFTRLGEDEQLSSSDNPGSRSKQAARKSVTGDSENLPQQPARPKKPEDAFSIFVKEASEAVSVSQEHLRKEWKNMSSAERSGYVEKADKDMERYNREVKAYSKANEALAKAQKKQQKKDDSRGPQRNREHVISQQTGSATPVGQSTGANSATHLSGSNIVGSQTHVGQSPLQMTPTNGLAAGSYPTNPFYRIQRPQVQAELQRQEYRWIQTQQVQRLQRSQQMHRPTGAGAGPLPPKRAKRTNKRKAGSDDDEEFVDSDSGDASSGMDDVPKLGTLSPAIARRGRRTTNTIRYNDDEYESAYQEAIAEWMSPHATAETTSADDLHEMDKVKHLSSLEISSETGRPVAKFTCFGSGAEILYDFQVDIKPSGIPNAGFGAFLTYQGARKLKPESQGRKQAERKGLLIKRDLKVMSDDGFGVNVKLVGEVIDGGASSDNPRAIGPGGIYEESDYEPSPTTKFCTFAEGNGLIHLGRYGPFRRNDRKPILNFSVKSFLFCHEPQEWCFGVAEKLFGREDQMIDITDDVTGKTHQLAEKNLPMYVNEIGHNKDLVQTVESRESRDRSVEYYIRIDKPMNKGQQVELLTDYFDFYEDVRERKGYGKRNMSQGVKSDEDLGGLLSRNFDSRRQVELDIRDLAKAVFRDNTICRTFNLIEFLEECIRVPLAELTNRYLEACSRGEADAVETPSSLQWVAMLRFHWLSSVFMETLCAMEETLETTPDHYQAGYPWKSMIEQCKTWASKMKWEKFPHLWQLESATMGSDGKNIRDAISREIVETLCYKLNNDKLSQEMRSPFDSSIWCPVARDLVLNICKEIGLAQLVPDDNREDATNKHSLLDKIYSFASDAVEEIRTEAAAYKERYTRLDFSSGVPTTSIVYAKQIGSLRRKCFEFNTLDPKGTVAALADLLTYFDCTFLADDHFLSGNFSVPVAFDKRFVMTRYTGFKTESQLSALPRSVEDGRKCNATLNETWYIMWQVIHIVHLFGQKFLAGPGGDGGGSESVATEQYSLEKLCTHVGFPFELANKVVGRGMMQRTVWEKPVKPPKTNRKSSAVGDAPNAKRQKKLKSKAASTNTQAHSRTSYATTSPRLPAVEVWHGPPDDALEGGWPEGWTKKLFQRQSGATKGDTDKYWYTPKKNFRFRSMREVQRYLGFLRMLGNTEADEETAWRMFKGKQN